MAPSSSERRKAGTVAKRVPAALAMRLGLDGTKGLGEMFDAEQQTWTQQVLTVVTERFERRLLDECAKLRVEMARDRFELLKWMFLFGSDRSRPWRPCSSACCAADRPPGPDRRLNSQRRRVCA